jgi:hypothetical protein
MRSRLLALLAAATAALLLAGPSAAASCPLVTDPRGDAHPVTYDEPTPLDASLGADATDILAVDAWVDDRSINVALRLAQLPDPKVTRAHGHMWSVQLRAENGLIDVIAAEGNGNYDFNSTWSEVVGSDEAGASAPVNLHNTVGTADRTTSTLRMSVPLELFAPYTKVSRGMRWTPSAWAWLLLGPPSFRAPGGYAYLGPGGVGNPSDRAQGGRAVRIGYPECVRR